MDNETMLAIAKLESKIYSLSLQADNIALAQNKLEREYVSFRAETEARFIHLEKRMDHLEERLDRVEERLDRVEERLDRVEERLDEQLSLLQLILQKLSDK
jgi:chromosome segregation ATPase